MLLSEPGRTDYDINFEMFGIPVRVHPAFFILPVLLGRGMIDSEMNVGVGMLLVAALFFVSILIHELGHVFAYRYFGQAGRIVLYWMGGIAMRIPETCLGPEPAFADLRAINRLLFHSQDPRQDCR